ncbi:MAG: hypothetical protein KY445_06335 [Armatimonadetes bacterium]|nr:hypothetical protein [Armatimonadota bacterium]
MKSKSEWIEKRDVNGRLLFFYSPLRDVIRLKNRDTETEIDLHALRQESLHALLGISAATGVK